MKLMAKDVGVDKEKRGGHTSKFTTGANSVEDEPHADEINFMEDALHELQSEDADEYEGDDPRYRRMRSWTSRKWPRC